MGNEKEMAQKNEKKMGNTGKGVNMVNMVDGTG